MVFGRLGGEVISVLGIIVEGPYDEKIIRALVSRIQSEEPIILPVGGKTKLRKKLPGWLEYFRYENTDKVLIIRDQDQECIKTVVEALQKLLAGREYPFQKIFCVIKVTIETWLLADEQAISNVVGQPVPPVQGNLEDIQNPKERLIRILSTANVDYTPERARQIAAVADLEKIAYRFRVSIAFGRLFWIVDWQKVKYIQRQHWKIMKIGLTAPEIREDLIPGIPQMDFMANSVYIPV